MIWDVNGYYQELGASVYASREELRRAYRRKKGWRSPRLTYIFKQLLDPTIRRLYDSMPFGQVFWDRYVEDIVRKEAAKQAAQLRRAGFHEQADEVADYDSPFSHIEDDERIWKLSESAVTVDQQWPWSYYLWQSDCEDTERLAQWQTELVEAMGGQTVEIAIGFAGDHVLQFAIERVGFRLVAFLGDRTRPSKKIAQRAAEAIKLSRGE
jgi:hypothetical protein